MKIKVWRILVAVVILIFLSSYFIIFENHQTSPNILGLPFIFGISIILTVVLVICTFIGAKFFPYKHSDKS